ncbi:hypothetical protein ELG64_01045 [Rhizobium leguminosarum]|uniref:hypothetical protein n=1 Tax=Rhizobium leguminosarum TaxID=384 RepID=UPI001030DB94|nr:hypothetical protein [Rhizobium leguminosarum]TBH22190.1 hypothetical protein ELG64_01045 [Rhizobium leguminosarum]
MRYARFTGLISVLVANAIPGTALGQSVRIVPDLTTNSIVVFQGVDETAHFYYVPLEMDFVRAADGKPRLGVQYFKEGDGDSWRVAVSTSIKPAASDSELAALKAKLPKDNNVTLSPLVLDFASSYVRFSEAKKPTIFSLESGTLSAGSSIAMKFEFTGTHDAVLQALAASGPEVGVMAIITPDASLVQGEELVFSGAAVADLFEKEKFLLLNSFDESNAVVAFIINGNHSAEAAARSWLKSKLGSPEIGKDDKGVWRYGWDLTRPELLADLRSSPKISLPTFSNVEPPNKALLLPFGNICKDYPDNIVNLETGTAGCN